MKLCHLNNYAVNLWLKTAIHTTERG